MMTVVLFILAALGAVFPAAAQPEPLRCPLPPYQIPLVAPERAFITEDGGVAISGIDAPLKLPDDLRARRLLWSDDGDVLMIVGRDGYRTGVFAYTEGELTQVLDHDTLLALRTEDFRDAVWPMNPQFVPGTHIVLFNTEILTDVEGIYFEIPWDLWSYDFDSGTLTELIPHGEGGDFTIAPDGSRIVLADLDKIWTIDIDAGNRTVLFEGVVAIGLGHSVVYPQIVWDTSGETPRFRALLFPDYDPNRAEFDVPFYVYEFALDDARLSEVVFYGPQVFIPAMSLSPDGYRVVEWRWQSPALGGMVSVNLTSAGAPEMEGGTLPVELTTFEVPAGLGAYAVWDDNTHVRYGYFTRDGRVEWRIDLCGEVVPLSGQ